MVFLPFFPQANLANLLNKPIIPILIDRMTWPPPGSMSMLFAQLLYIQFYTGHEYVVGEKFWEDPKFAELLAQINYHAAPDPEMITDGMYPNMVFWRIRILKKMVYKF